MGPKSWPCRGLKGACTGSGVATTCTQNPQAIPRPWHFVHQGETLAYLAGIVDGDGYFKVARAYRTPGTVHPYYATIVGVQQLWPSDAVSLFAAVFGGTLTGPERTPGSRPMARCEVRGAKADSAARHLLPFLLLKKAQALLLLEVETLRHHRRGRPRPGEAVHVEMETVRQALLALHTGSWRPAAPLPLDFSLKGYQRLSPNELGWSRAELLAYLAGIIDSDGNLRAEKRRVRDMRGPHFRINIRCSQVIPSPAVELLTETFGGRLGLRKASRPNHRDLVSWSLHDKAAAQAVEALLPHLRVKWLEAHLLLELMALKARGKQGVTIWRHRTRWQRPIRMQKRCYTADQNAEFERIHRAVQALHAGGAKRPAVIESE